MPCTMEVRTAQSFISSPDAVSTTCRIVVSYDLSSTRYFLPDHLNSTNVLTDASGTPIQVLDTYPYGSNRINQQFGSGFNEAKQYIGQYQDPETNLSYLQARYYDGSKGEFLSEDPSYLAVGNPNQVKQVTGQDQSAFLADPQQSNSYGYARDNPITRSDPAGNSSDPFMGAFIWGGGDPASASARQQAYAQVQAGLQGYYSAAKASAAVVAGAGAVMVDPQTLPYVLGGWANVASDAYSDYQNGGVDTSGKSYVGSFALGAAQESKLVQSGRLVSVLAKSTAFSAFGSLVANNGSISTRSLVANAAGVLAGRITETALSYSPGSTQRVLFTQLSQAIASLGAQIATLQATAPSQSKTSK